MSKLINVVVTGNSVYYKGSKLEKGAVYSIPESVVNSNPSSFELDDVIKAEFIEVKPKKKKSKK